MIVEVFIKGSFFKNLYDTFWNVKSVVYDGGYFCLVFYNTKEKTIVLSREEYELRCS